MNGSKENARVVKTYVCACGEVNRFSLETDFNVTEVRIDAHCQGCGKSISISVENFFRSNSNGSTPSTSSMLNGYASTNGNYNPYNSSSSYPSQPSSSSPPSNSPYSPPYSQYPANSSDASNSSSSSSSSNDSSSSNSGMMDFNFDALTNAATDAASSMSPISTEQNSSSQTATAAQSSSYSEASASSASYSDNAEVINSLSSDIMQDAESPVEEVAEPAPPALAKVVQTPAKRIIEAEKKDEEEDLLSQEENNYGTAENSDAPSEDQEAFIDLFGRL